MSVLCISHGHASPLASGLGVFLLFGLFILFFFLPWILTGFPVARLLLRFLAGGV